MIRDLAEQGRSVEAVRIDKEKAIRRGAQFRNTAQLRADLLQVQSEAQSTLNEGASKTKMKSANTRMSGTKSALGYLKDYRETHAVGNVPPEAITPVRNIKADVWGARARTAGRVLGPAGMAFGAYSTYRNISEAPPGHLNNVIATEAGSWSAGLYGAAAGARLGMAGGPWGVLAGGIAGGIAFGTIGALFGSQFFQPATFPEGTADPDLEALANQPDVLTRIGA